jgi:Family of unknown function (DUF6312)
MDKLVKRVTVVQGSGDNREAKVVYTSDDDDSDDGSGQPNFKNLEKSVRHMLKAQMIAAQEAYQRHLDSTAKKERNAWLYDAPGNFMKARRKAMKEMRKAAPFRKPKIEFEKVNDDEED